MTRSSRVVLAAAALATVLGASACAGSTGAPSPAGPRSVPVTTSATATSTTGSGHAGHAATTPPSAALRKGERFVDVAMPTPYTPSPPSTGTDDYRCFLLDPALTKDSFVTGLDVRPGNPDVVHHVILFRVPPAQVGRAQALDRGQPGEGWTCFGGSGVERAGGSLDGAPWIGAWAPGGGERVMAADVGIPMQAGSRIVMQVHYNLLAGTAPDTSAARLRVAPGSAPLAPLQTVLLPAPVELPCRPGKREPLCSRPAAVADVQARFGTVTGQTGNYLNLLCSGRGPGKTQSCTRPVTERETIRAVAGHMHLLGRSIRVVVNQGRAGARTVLEIPLWDFDNQASIPLAQPVAVGPGDTLTVTCTHDQAIRDVLPAFAGQRERYVVWGEGTTDEMCLGIVLVTRP